MRLTHLHAHTTFSFLDGYGTPDQIAARLKELGHTACAITDHGNLIGHVPCAQAYEKAGIKPIFGCEFYICDNILEEGARGKDYLHATSTGTKGLPHITVLARNQRGYANLLKLSRLSYEKGFYYKPRIDHAHLIANQDGLVVLSGCPTGYPTRMIQWCNQDNLVGYDKVRDYLLAMKNAIEHYYIEIVPQPNFTVSHYAAPVLLRLAQELGIPAVMTADCHFPQPKDYAAQDALLAVGLRTQVDDATRELQLPEYQYYCSAEELLQRAQLVIPMAHMPDLQLAIENSVIIGDMCDVTLQKAAPVTFPGVQEGDSSANVLWQWCLDGLNKRFMAGMIPPDKWDMYCQRVQREWITLNSKGFCDYILVIADVIRWMKNREGLVMTRGSAGGSLMLWLLEASETDPILHGLTFERFYDDTRPDPPDVDIDFEQARRDEAIEYIYQTYGRNNCSQIAALSRLGPKGAVADAGYALGIHRRKFSALSDVLNDKDMDMDAQFARLTDPQALALLAEYPRLKDLAAGMCGQYRHQSVHAAGMLVSSAPLEEVIGVIISGDKAVAAIDKKGASYLGFLKIDMLSVQGLDVVGQAARKARGDVKWLYTLPLDDQSVFNTAKEGRLAGIFQLDGAAANQALKAIGADSFRDLVAASVLCRPGCAEFISVYKENKYNADKFAAYLANMHPGIADIVKETYGVLMYQEQVMRIAREIAGLDWKLVHKLRKDVADKVGLDPQKGDAWRAEWHERFVGGAMSHSGMPQQEAEYWWATVQHHGGYSFNKSHALTYGVIGYWMLYLKTYYPAQFYEAYLRLENDDVVKKRLINEFKRAGGTVRLIDEFSDTSFSSRGPFEIVGGFSDLKFIGPAGAKKLSEQSPFTDFQTMMSALPKRTRELLQAAVYGDGSYNPQALIKLAPWMPVSSIGADELALMNHYMLKSVSDAPLYRTEGNIKLCGYVTLTQFDKDKVMFTLEDDRGMAVIRIAAGKVKSIGPIFRTLNEGDFICVEGWWTGEGTMFAKQFAMIKKGE